MSRLTRLAILALLGATAPVHAASPDVERVIRDLARPAPVSIAFTEVRFSPLLARPLIVSGELRYLNAGSLVREVTEPYRERTTIRGESVRVERDGESLRTFALARAPELRGLVTAFASMLAGDVENLEAHFDIALHGEDPWMMTLTPREARARRRISDLQMTGHGGEPACLALNGADGAQSVMVFGIESAETLDTDIAPEQLNERCASSAKRQ